MKIIKLKFKNIYRFSVFTRFRKPYNNKASVNFFLDKIR